ncbi:MAG: hypothetical protein ACYCT2_09240 [Thermoplasmataceae archaeon]
MKIAILTEDRYGVQFFQNLVSFLKKSEMIRNHLAISPKRYNIYKLTNLLRTVNRDYDKTIVIVDCDGSCDTGNSKEISEIIKKESTENVIQVNLDFEIEEWICISEKIDYGKDKPSVVLWAQRKYEKYQLPKYANNLNIGELESKSVSFSTFMRSLNR